MAACAGVGLAGWLSRGDGAPGAPALVLTVAGSLLCVPSAVNVVVGPKPGRRRAHLIDAFLLAGLAVASWAHYDTVHLSLAPGHVALGESVRDATLRSRLVEVRRSADGHANVVLDVLEFPDPAAPASPGAAASGLVWARWPDGEATPSGATSPCSPANSAPRSDGGTPGPSTSLSTFATGVSTAH